MASIATRFRQYPLQLFVREHIASRNRHLDECKAAINLLAGMVLKASLDISCPEETVGKVDEVLMCEGLIIGLFSGGSCRVFDRDSHKQLTQLDRGVNDRIQFCGLDVSKRAVLIVSKSQHGTLHACRSHSIRSLKKGNPHDWTFLLPDNNCPSFPGRIGSTPNASLGVIVEICHRGPVITAFQTADNRFVIRVYNTSIERETMTPGKAFLAYTLSYPGAYNVLCNNPASLIVVCRAGKATQHKTRSTLCPPRERYGTHARRFEDGEEATSLRLEYHRLSDGMALGRLTLPNNPSIEHIDAFDDRYLLLRRRHCAETLAYDMVHCRETALVLVSGNIEENVFEDIPPGRDDVGSNAISWLVTFAEWHCLVARHGTLSVLWDFSASAPSPRAVKILENSAEDDNGQNYYLSEELGLFLHWADGSIQGVDVTTGNLGRLLFRFPTAQGAFGKRACMYFDEGKREIITCYENGQAHIYGMGE